MMKTMLKSTLALFVGLGFMTPFFGYADMGDGMSAMDGMDRSSKMGKSEYYFAIEMGYSMGTSLSTQGKDNDYGTLCDNYLDPRNALSPINADKTAAAGAEPAGCSTGDKWTNGFGSGTASVMSSLAWGYYGFGPRVELEYLYTSSSHDETSVNSVGTAATGLKADQELQRTDERIGNVTSSSFFANVYYDVPTQDKKISWYVGAGIGWGVVEVDYSSVWARHSDPARIQTGVVYEATATPNDPSNDPSGTAFFNGAAADTSVTPNLPALDPNTATDRQAYVAEFRQKLAGTTTTADAKLSDNLFGYQLVAGVDRKLNETVTLGFKARWVRFADFSDGNAWDQLRSHASNNGAGTPNVEYQIDIDEIDIYGVSVGLRYSF